MPSRLTPLVDGEHYHVYNRGVNKQPIFLDTRDYTRAFESMMFYSYTYHGLKYSHFLKLSTKDRKEILDNMEKNGEKIVDIICYCFMPNHFHFLLKQIGDNGISTFMRLYQNSYTRFFNTKHERIGPLLQGQFKAKRVEDDPQLIHLSRYIHLNPYTSYVVKNLESLAHYPHSSYPEYLGFSPDYCAKEIILSQFSETNKYRKFVEDGADYQRELDTIKHLLLEEIQ